MGTALLIGIFVGIPLGVLSALRQYSKTDYALTGIAFLGISIPSFMLGLGGLYIFGLILPHLPDRRHGHRRGAVLDPGPRWRHLALPAMILGVGYVAILMRYTRSSMLEVLGSLYITTAVAKGLPSRVVDRAPRLPQCPHPDHHDHRAVAARAGRRRGHHRDGLQLAGPRQHDGRGRLRSATTR